jgi:hypothetical protein
LEKSLHLAASRGHANHGWLKSYHTFSFASYFDPNRMSFGTLRVINDDVIDPSTGFDTHSHQNMEIISIPLSGKLHHKDTMGNDFKIAAGEVQVMSAGTGISHSEYNDSNSESANFLQIWVFPKKNNIVPSYAQKEFSTEGRKNKFQLIVSPAGIEGAVKIDQDAYFSLIELDKDHQADYQKYEEQNGVYFFVIDGELQIGDQGLSKRDGLGLEKVDNINLKASLSSSILVMEVPMTRGE